MYGTMIDGDFGARMSRPACPVCRSADSHSLVEVEGRRYWACPVCEVRYLDPSRHPTPDEERAQYALHRNEVDDPGYRKFLARLATPLLERLAPASSGLDYGCGPGPALAAMLREAGQRMAVYDPLYAPDRKVLGRSYDFITCSEVVEHFHQPADEFVRLTRLVRPGGWIAVMTCFQTDDSRFARWHYRRDPTHVVFYREATFRYIAKIHGLFLEFPARNVALMQKSTNDGNPPPASDTPGRSSHETTPI